MSDPTLITELGSLLSKLPLSPKFAKMLIVSTKYQVLKYVIMIVACLSVPEMFRELPADKFRVPDLQIDYDDVLQTEFDR